jgi:pimeloyl-ACP methyl ester carboxylesterase
MEHLNLTQPVLVSPSMSGHYSLPLVVQHPQKLSGFVAVAPVGIPSFEPRLKGIELPTLAIWGSNDQIVLVAQADRLCHVMPNAHKVILENAGHACYMRATAEFHQHLLRFVESCYAQGEPFSEAAESPG